MIGGSALLVLALLAVGMAASTAGLIKWAATARTTLRAGTVVFLLLMMVAMIGGALVYFLRPSAGGLVGGFWFASALMSVSVVVIFYAFLVEVRSQEEGRPAVQRGPRAGYLAAVLGLVLLNEVLMGWTFGLAAGTLGPGAADGALGLFQGIVASPWFLFTMGGEMLLTTYLLRDALPGPVAIVLAAQSAIMLLSPPALLSGAWRAFAIYAGSAAMIGLFVYLMEFIYRHRQLTAAFARYLVRLLAVYGAMMLGLYLWLADGNVLLFAVAVVAEMVLFFDTVLRSEPYREPPRVVWQLRPNWAFALLAGVFVAEVFMGALLDLQIAPAAFAGAFRPLPLAGPLGTVAYDAVYNGFWFLAATTASTWFLAMMGVEMGTLVYFKFRESRELETRIRLVLVMGMYGGFAVFFPSAYYAAVFPGAPSGAAVPLLGWSMGIGTEALGLGVLGVVALTYVIAGAASALFGRRAICGTFCTAALMYQGTTLDAMKSFNRSARVGHKYLGSRLSTAYSVTTGAAVGGLLLATTASVLDTAGIWHVHVLGADPTVFFYALSFSVLWYVTFVATPYLGTYNCVTLGYCYTGAIAQAFQKIGFYKLKVDSPEVCRRCTTLDCAKACPIGLVDMPGHFRTKGEFRSSKCCGVGDCVGACPYGNLYVYDVRHWLRERLGRPPRVERVHRLPMVPARPAAGPSAAVASAASANGPMPGR